jgi:hypothetical protein
MNTRLYFISLVLLLPLLLVSCQASENSLTESENTLTESEDAMHGTVRFINLEGGFYGIEADDGTKYNPLNLPEAFKQDGLRVAFRVQVREDVATIQQWGTPAEIVEISNLE